MILTRKPNDFNQYDNIDVLLLDRTYNRNKLLFSCSVVLFNPTNDTYI